MKLTKQKELEALKLYHLYWDSYIKGDFETFTSTLDEEFEMIGTSESEVAHNKTEGIEFFKGQMAEVVGKADMRNRQINAKLLKDMVLINEDCDIYVLGGPEWTFYSKIRISTLLHETDSGWKIIQQHGSFPDMRVQEGETIAIEKISRENVELRDAVKRRTAELENKNRELEIEAAVERVRAQSMTIHHSDDLHKVTEELHHQLKKLSIDGLTGTTIYLVDANDIVEAWDLSSPGNIGTPGNYTATYDAKKYPVNGGWVKEWRTTDKNLFELEFPKEDLLKAVEEWKEILPEVGAIFENAVSSGKLTYQWSLGGRLSKGMLVADLIKPPTEDTKNIVSKMAGAFNLAYQRFEDLRKAEAQAREAKIEAALEKVRSRSLAMNKSDELNEVVAVLFEKLKDLQVPFTAVGIATGIDDSKDLNAFVCGQNDDGLVITNYRLPYFDNIVAKDFCNALEKQLDFFVGHYSKQEKDAFYEYVIEHTAEFRHLPEDIKRMIFDSTSYTVTIIAVNNATFNINDFEGKVLVDNEIDIIKRFARVFDQTYTRFLDLKKAEAQAKEAKIEVALEKVRSRTMGMQKSDELSAVANVLFEEMNELVHNLWTCGFVLCEKDRTEDEWWLSLENGFTRGFFLPNVNDYAHAHLYEGWLKKDDFRTVQLEGDQLQAHYDWLMEIPIAKSIFEDMEAAGMQRPEWQKLHAAYFSKGYLVIITREPCAEEAIFKRFAQVFDLTYTRFLDLQKAEAQAREAQVELSLERVRAQVTGMQESSDLFDIVVSMRSEFLSLGHEADYFWHMRWLPDVYEMSMTSEAGDRLGMVIKIPKFVHDQIPDLAEWEKGNNAIFVLALDADQAWDYIDNMNTYGQYEQVDPHAPTREDIEHIGGLTFIIARTTHGEIGYSLPGMVPEPPKDALDTLVRFAGVFDLAYKRFEDLKAAERQAQLIREERDRLEIALNELHATQDQLVQQEKLASLGQLTAGIAHEIKNPLNFVNNFSDVSLEMIDEALEELQKIGENEYATETAAILADIKANLAKIHEHGSRADGIVKSMLMHSRGGSGKMKPTDLNAMIREYVNLAFHGMRAGKNPINVDIQIDLDDSFGKIALIKEDFSRVLLNLCNNAFDAMRETALARHPRLIVRTKPESKHVLIEVADNGPGIPDEIKDKILQPFFTTKKGTQGTGLGLSITNDIVKAHGGLINIKTKEHEGTTFTIELHV